MRLSFITGALALISSVTSLALQVREEPPAPISGSGTFAAALLAKRANPWAARHGLTTAQYQTVANDFASQGYRITWISGYTINNVATYAVIFEKKPTAAWVSRIQMTAAQYQSNFNTYIAQGYRPILVNGYNVGGTDYYVAIWDASPAPGAWIARHGLTAADYQTQFTANTAAGYYPFHISGYSIGPDATSSPRYAAIWIKIPNAPAWVARHGLTSAAYQTETNTWVAQNYRTKIVCGYQVAGVVYYAAVWDKSAGSAWGARHGMTSAGYQAEVNTWVAAGYAITLTVISA
ncbi:hypothetical protein M7I_0099 [Glarea lozoyensis 74030]|uniref:Uncharacterized protein n=1 Tax=Glarea lozoyensis (strain ATCC 74030 / MF5533) TaxID=1104152 RepID=H0ECG1_GLAL7|nr:hypothetical protein M7I_0099 [Glarea lozoyensis 74030]